MKECNCEDWKLGSPQLVEAQMSSFMNGIKYIGEVFRFCPWCSNPLEEESHNFRYDEFEKEKSK